MSDMLFQRCIKSTLILTLILLSPNLQAQHAQLLYEKGDSLLRINALDSAEVHYQAAAQLFQEEGNMGGYFNAQMHLFEIINAQQRFEELGQKTQKVLAELRISEAAKPVHFAQTYRKIGAIEEFYSGNLKAALDHYKTGLSYMNSDKAPKPPLVYTELMKDIGLMFSYINSPDSARLYFKQALNLNATHYPENLTEQADLTRMMAMSFYYEYNPKPAISGVKEALEILSGAEINQKVKYMLSDLYGNLSDAFSMAGYYDSALYMLEKKKVIEDEVPDKNTVDYAYLYMQRSTIMGLKGDLESAKEDMKEAIRINTLVLGPNHLRTAQCYSKLAQFIIEQNRALDEAQGYLKRTYQVYLEVAGPDNPGTGLALLHLGNLHLQKKEMALALDYYKKALTVHKKNRSTLNIAETETALGNAYIAMEKYDLAMKFIDSSIKGYESFNMATEEPVADNHILKADIFQALKKPEKALRHLGQAEQIYKQSLGAKHTKLADLYFDRASIYQRQEKQTDALKWIQKAIVSNSYKFEDDNYQNNPLVNDFISGVKMLRYLAAKAILIKKQSNEDSLEGLLAAQVIYDLCIGTIQQLVKEQNTDKDIISLNNTFRNIYDQAFTNTFEMFKISGKPEIKEKLLKLSGQSRASALILAQSQKSAKAYAKIPQALIDQEKQLLKEIAYLKSRLQSPKSLEETQLNYFENRLFLAQTEQLQLLEKLEKDYEEYFALKYQVKTYSSEQIQKRISPEEAYVEYFKTDSTLYTLIITKQSFDIQKTALDFTISGHISDFNKAIKGKSQQKTRESGRLLYQIMVKPFLDLLAVERLILLPDKELWAVNFDLLQDEDEQYLIETYAISYAYSPTVLYAKMQKRQPPKHLLAFSYSEPVKGEQLKLSTLRNEGLEKLPGAAKEIAAIAAIADGDYYYGSEAKEGHFKKVAADFTILHLALHGEVDHNDGDNSKLFFQPAENDSTEDGVLYPFEIYDMDLNAELAVLSACDTGAGIVTSGEGIISLGRAFQYAGVNSLLLSQWEVSDPVSPVIMEAFYTHLHNGENKALALRLAKLEFLKTADNVAAAPYYWGGFFILGNTDPIYLRTSNGRYYLYQVFGLIFLGVIGFLMRKRQAQKQP